MYSVVFQFSRKHAKLTLRKEGRTLDSESWGFDEPVSSTERRECAKFVFDEVYDFLNDTIHGPVEYDATEDN